MSNTFIVQGSGAKQKIDAIFGYNISDTEEATGDGTSYYGFINEKGAWYIMKAVLSSGVTNYTYARGDSGYNWSNRASETYNRFDIIF